MMLQNAVVPVLVQSVSCSVNVNDPGFSKTAPDHHTFPSMSTVDLTHYGIFIFPNRSPKKVLQDEPNLTSLIPSFNLQLFDAAVS